ncbi:MAG: enoyl-CoA hydratase-related protein [Emcibacteraceae bacterium]|nr:enoyl-CoA hydratase-related protein [Emcibacteraceae bacterium]
MTILFEQNNHGIARLKLNRPDVHNAFNSQMINDLHQAFISIGNNPDIKALILSGEGASLSSGADLNWMKQAAEYSDAENMKDALLLSDMLDAFYNLDVLTIACAKGAVMGGGLGLIACADIVIADAQSRFAFSEVKLGLTPATISPYVIKAIGGRYAKRYFQTAEKINVKRAYEMGLIHEVTASIDEMNEVVDGLLHQIKSNAPMAMRNSKKLVNEFEGQEISDDLRIDTAKRIAKARASNEAKEGLSAFFEKRKADWTRDV